MKSKGTPFCWQYSMKSGTHADMAVTGPPTLPMRMRGRSPRTNNAKGITIDNINITFIIQHYLQEKKRKALTHLMRLSTDLTAMTVAL
jgi:hypothetical protein